MAKKEAKTEEPKQKKKSKLPLILIIVVILAAGGGFAYFKFFKAAPEGDGTEVVEPTPEETPEAEFLEYAFDAMVINLSDFSGRKYIKIAVTVQYEDETLTEKIEKRKARIQDMFHSVVSSRSARELLSGEEGYAKMKKDMKAKLDIIIGRDKITDIYFPTRTVQ